MATTTIATGGQVTQDPSAVKVYLFDWDRSNLPAGVAIASSEWYAFAIRPTFTATALTIDQEAVLNAADATLALGRTVVEDSRVTRMRLSGGAMHHIYEVTNSITTNETPSQTKHKSFRVLVEQE